MPDILLRKRHCKLAYCGMEQLSLFGEYHPRAKSLFGVEKFAAELEGFREFGKKTRVTETRPDGCPAVATFINEFWPARQRNAHSLHEISYRACFKPRLPRFFIERLTLPGAAVYDPFMGRGTTCIEAALLGRRPIGCDINPLSRILVAPRLAPPSIESVRDRLASLSLRFQGEMPEELLVFYHPDTLREICALRARLIERENSGELDEVDSWIRMAAVNRLTGHSSGFFSVYTMPPNQAVSVKSQIRINRRLKQTPPRRRVVDIILRKSRRLLADRDAETMSRLADAAAGAILLTAPAAETPAIPSGSVDLVITSPPFLSVVDYAGDNWLRCWFCGIDAEKVKITMARRLLDWEEAMTGVLRELRRVLHVGGYVAFEVGEVQKGSILLEESVIRCALTAGLQPELVVINDQEFTKTSNCWGVSNRVLGTNTNRIVLMRKRSET